MTEPQDPIAPPGDQPAGPPSQPDGAPPAPGFGTPPGYGAPYQPPGYPTGYGQPQYAPQPNGATNGFAIASMVLGIVWIYWIGSILALVFGYIALKQIKQRQESGRGMAIAGVVLGWVGVAVIPLIVLAVFAMGTALEEAFETPIDSPTHGTASPSPQAPITLPALAPAGWRGPAVSGASVPAQTRRDARNATDGKGCRMMLPTLPIDARPRAANFTGGWAMAWDVPRYPGSDGKGRGAFLVAGNQPVGQISLGADPGDPQIAYRDGSLLLYFLEGGTGPSYLGRLEIEGVDCQYSVAAPSPALMQQFVASLRFVR